MCHEYCSVVVFVLRVRAALSVRPAPDASPLFICRYQQLQQPTQLRKHRLMESLRVQQLFRDMEDEAAWIREKEPVAASTNRGTDTARPVPAQWLLFER